MCRPGASRRLSSDPPSSRWSGRCRPRQAPSAPAALPRRCAERREGSQSPGRRRAQGRPPGPRIRGRSRRHLRRQAHRWESRADARGRRGSGQGGRGRDLHERRGGHARGQGGDADHSHRVHARRRSRRGGRREVSRAPGGEPHRGLESHDRARSQASGSAQGARAAACAGCGPSITAWTRRPARRSPERSRSPHGSESRSCLEPSSRRTSSSRFLERLRPGDALLVPDIATMDISAVLLETSLARRIPAVFSSELWVSHGGLVSYGADYRAQGVQAARLVGKILHGTRVRKIFPSRAPTASSSPSTSRRRRPSGSPRPARFSSAPTSFADEHGDGAGPALSQVRGRPDPARGRHAAPEQPGQSLLLLPARPRRRWSGSSASRRWPPQAASSSSSPGSRGR